MASLVIIAAGNGKRMGDITVPKALYEVNGKPNLFNTITKTMTLFDKIFLVIKSTAYKTFDEFIKKYGFNNCVLIPIESGLGDGHAVMTALMQPQISDDELILLWGDAYIYNDEIVKELLEVKLTKRNPLVFPVNSEENPYVTITVDQMMNVVAADFSKLGENHQLGLHDQSIFKLNKKVLLKSLINMHECFWKNGRYISESKELNLLHSFHVLYNRHTPARAYISDYSVGAFNTIEEAKALSH